MKEKRLFINVKLRSKSMNLPSDSIIIKNVEELITKLGKKIWDYPPVFSHIFGEFEYEITITSLTGNKNEVIKLDEISINILKSDKMDFQALSDSYQAPNSNIDMQHAFSRKTFPSRDRNENIIMKEAWKSLFFEDEFKELLISFIRAIININHKLNRHQVVSSRINLSQSILFFGPPGTGKTTLAEGLATVLADELGHTYKNPLQIYRFNVSSLSSSHMGETQKLVQNALQMIRLAAERYRCVCILDEVESIAYSRYSIQGAPPDALIAVNVLLNELDNLAKNPNVFLFLTSNITERIDSALLDRCDLHIKVPLPTQDIAQQIFIDTTMYLQHLDFENIKSWKEIEGLSGRSIRKIPIIMYTLFLMDNPTSTDVTKKIIIPEYYFSKAIELLKQMKL